MIAYNKPTLSFTCRILLITAILAIVLLLGFLHSNFVFSSANITPTATLENNAETINPANAQNLVELDRLGRGTITDIVWSPDGQLLAVSSQVGVEIFDANQLSSPAIIVLPRYLSGVNTVAFSPDGRLLATGSGAFPFGDFDEDNAVQMWDTSTWQVKYTFVAHETPVYDIVFSPDGTVFATSNNYEVKVWDTFTGLNIASFSGKANPLAFSPVDNQLALTSETSTEIWDYTSLELLFTLDNPSGESWSMAFSPDGEILAVVADTITLWDVEQQEIFDTFRDNCRSCSIQMAHNSSILIQNSE